MRSGDIVRVLGADCPFGLLSPVMAIGQIQGGEGKQRRTGRDDALSLMDHLSQRARDQIIREGPKVRVPPQLAQPPLAREPAQDRGGKRIGDEERGGGDEKPQGRILQPAGHQRMEHEARGGDNGRLNAEAERRSPERASFGRPQVLNCNSQTTDGD